MGGTRGASAPEPGPESFRGSWAVAGCPSPRPAASNQGKCHDRRINSPPPNRIIRPRTPGVRSRCARPNSGAPSTGRPSYRAAPAGASDPPDRFNAARDGSGGHSWASAGYRRDPVQRRVRCGRQRAGSARPRAGSASLTLREPPPDVAVRRGGVIPVHDLLILGIALVPLPLPERGPRLVERLLGGAVVLGADGLERPHDL